MELSEKKEKEYKESIDSSMELEIALRGKEKGDEVVFIHSDELRTGIINKVCKYPKNSYFIRDEDNNTYTKGDNYLWFNSPNIEIKINAKGLFVTGEEEPEPAKIITCPICHKPLSISYCSNDNTKSNGVHFCAFNTEIKVNNDTFDEVYENLCKLYNLIVGRLKI